MSKAFVMQALQRLVDDDLAEWDQTEAGDLELRLTTGEAFIVSDAGITPKKQLRDAAPRSSIDLIGDEAQPASERPGHSRHSGSGR